MWFREFTSWNHCSVLGWRHILSWWELTERSNNVWAGIRFCSLEFFNVDQIFSNNYYGNSTQYYVKISDEQYIRDSHCDSECCSIGNDKIYTHALQEELSQLSITEAPKFSGYGEKSFQDSTVDPSHSPLSNYYLGMLILVLTACSIVCWILLLYISNKKNRICRTWGWPGRHWWWARSFLYFGNYRWVCTWWWSWKEVIPAESGSRKYVFHEVL